jgi:hypothetical protein
LFDLVLVGSNYDQEGPVTWGGGGTAGATAYGPPFLHRAAVDLRFAGGMATGHRIPTKVDWSTARSSARGGTRGAPVTLGAEEMDDDTLELTVAVRGVQQLYGADFVLRYDPERLRPIDALAAEPGIQAAPGAAWGADPYIAVNTVDRGQHALRFAVSRRRPDQPLAGDVVVATAKFRLLGDSADGAYGLERVRLADRLGRPIDARWNGLDVSPLPGWGSLLQRLFLPWNSRAVGAPGGRR